jgi:hypothetical protein
MKIETYLPVFNGFYSTLFEPSEHEIEEECTRYDCEWDALKFNNKEYEIEVAKHLTLIIEHELKALGMVNTIEFQKVISPKFYNFTNDSINVAIDYNKDAILKYIKANESGFIEHIKAEYSSRDGFMSSHTADGLEWHEEFENDTLPRPEHQMGAILDWICGTLDETQEEELFEQTYETRYISNYCEHDLPVVNE